MAYCRWSTDDYRSDVQVHDAEGGGVEIVVTDFRYELDEPLPAPVALPSSPTPDQVMASVRRDSQVIRMLRDAKRSPIGLPYDGQRLFEFDAPSAIASLEMLRGLGYRVPQVAFDALAAAATAATAASPAAADG